MGTSTFKGEIPPDDPRLQRTAIVVGRALSFGNSNPSGAKADDDSFNPGDIKVQEPDLAEADKDEHEFQNENGED